ncbi:MAG: hypothetical protein KG003_04975 [Bacteroidetes bacterium]|nr:hypothetical protein [Bacteroidota bacterium]
MTERKYKFHVDEARPKIPAPKEFASVLAAVKVKLPWYANPAFWGGAATVAISGVATFWWVKDQNQTQNKWVDEHYKESPIVQPAVSNKDTQPGEVTGVSTTVQYKAIPVIQDDIIEVESDFNVSTREVVDIAQETEQITAPEINNDLSDRGWNLHVPFDTIRVNPDMLPRTFVLRNGSKLIVPANAFSDENGASITEEFIILFREFTDQAQMLATSLYMEGKGKTGVKPLINNGTFEIQAMQNNKLLKIKPENPVVMQFFTLDPALVFSGYYAQNSNEIFEPLVYSEDHFIGISGVNKSWSYMERKRSFWQWLGDLVHRRKIKYDSFERVETTYYDYGTYKNIRTFEIQQTGFYASGRAMEMGFTNEATIAVSTEGNEHIEATLYQVFLNTNMIRKYDILNGRCAVQYSANDKCMLLALQKNSDKVLYLDAYSFDNHVKGSKSNVDISLKSHPNSIQKISDLQNLIKASNNMRSRRI